MHQGTDNDGLRQEIIRLLRAQMRALEASSALTDTELTACYLRQERVRELRDRLTQAVALTESVP